MRSNKFFRTLGGACSVIALVGCSSSVDSADEPERSVPTIATSSTSAGATTEATWEEVCKAAYAAGIGNAAMSEEAAWVKDCSEECTLPEFVGQCEDMAKELGVDAP